MLYHEYCNVNAFFEVECGDQQYQTLSTDLGTQSIRQGCTQRILKLGGRGSKKKLDPILRSGSRKFWWVGDEILN